MKTGMNSAYLRVYDALSQRYLHIGQSERSFSPLDGSSAAQSAKGSLTELENYTLQLGQENTVLSMLQKNRESFDKTRTHYSDALTSLRNIGQLLQEAAYGGESSRTLDVLTESLAEAMDSFKTSASKMFDSPVMQRLLARTEMGYESPYHFGEYYLERFDGATLYEDSAKTQENELEVALGDAEKTIRFGTDTGLADVAQFINENSKGEAWAVAEAAQLELFNGGSVVAGGLQAGDLSINGIDLGSVTIKEGDADGALESAINAISAQTGVEASRDSDGKLTLTNTQGGVIELNGDYRKLGNIGLINVSNLQDETVTLVPESSSELQYEYRIEMDETRLMHQLELTEESGLSRSFNLYVENSEGEQILVGENLSASSEAEGSKTHTIDLGSVEVSAIIIKPLDLEGNEFQSQEELDVYTTPPPPPPEPVVEVLDEGADESEVLSEEKLPVETSPESTVNESEVDASSSEAVETTETAAAEDDAFSLIPSETATDSSDVSSEITEETSELSLDAEVETEAPVEPEPEPLPDYSWMAAAWNLGSIQLSANSQKSITEIGSLQIEKESADALRFSASGETGLFESFKTEKLDITDTSFDSASMLYISQKLYTSAMSQMEEVEQELERANVMLKSKNSLHLGKMSVLHNRYNELFETEYGYNPQEILAKLRGSNNPQDLHNLAAISVSLY